MEKQIFFPVKKDSQIIFKISNNCPTNCKYCESGKYSEPKFVKKEQVIKNLDKVIELFGKEFNYMLYSGESLIYPGTKEILLKLKKHGINNVILHELDSITDEKILKSKEYSKILNITIGVIRKIYNLEQIKKIILYIKKILELNIKKINYFVNIDIDFNSKKILAKNLILILKNNGWLKDENIEKYYDTIKIKISNKVILEIKNSKDFFINEKIKKIENIPYKECTILKDCKIINDNIYIGIEKLKYEGNE